MADVFCSQVDNYSSFEIWGEKSCAHTHDFAAKKEQLKTEHKASCEHIQHDQQ